MGLAFVSEPLATSTSTCENDGAWLNSGPLDER
jgi:hypothetical protein